MSKAGYIGVESAGRKAKKIYFGVDGLARKVKKGYIGVDGVARLWFSAGTRITYTGAYMRQAVTNGGTEYNLYTLLTSGTLTLDGDAQYWMCGGGAGGQAGASGYSGHGGGGGYAGDGELTGGKYAVLIAAGGGSNTNGGATSLSSGTVNETCDGGKYTGNGGSGGGGGVSVPTTTYDDNDPPSVQSWGTGDGINKYPFGIESLKAHCAGGGGGMGVQVNNTNSNNRHIVYGGAGGSNGSDGEHLTGTISSGQKAAGGEYGGGSGYTTSNGAAQPATFFGSAGGGGGYGTLAYTSTNKDKTLSGTSGGSGYQGVVYLMVPKEMDDSEEPITPYTLTITGADSNSYVQTGGTNYTSATEMYVNNGQSVTVYAYGRYNTIKANGTTVASNSSYTQKRIIYTFEISASTTIAFSSGSATITY